MTLSIRINGHPWTGLRTVKVEREKDITRLRATALRNEDAEAYRAIIDSLGSGRFVRVEADLGTRPDFDGRFKVTSAGGFAFSVKDDIQSPMFAVETEVRMISGDVRWHHAGP